MCSVVQSGYASTNRSSVGGSSYTTHVPASCAIACNKRRACTPAGSQSLRKKRKLNGSGDVWFVCIVLEAKSYVWVPALTFDFRTDV